MARLISTLFIAADGVAEIDPEWHFPYFDDAMGAAVGDDYDTADVLVFGRQTYDSFSGAWPDREAAGLVDELRLYVHPVAARKGKRLFDEGAPAYHFTVTMAEVYPSGVIRVIYSRSVAPALSEDA